MEKRGASTAQLLLRCDAVILEKDAAIAAILTGAKNAAGHSLSDLIAHAFVAITTQRPFPPPMGVYPALPGFSIPYGGGNWLLLAPSLHQPAHHL